MWKRIVFDILIVLVCLAGPWWLTLVIGIIGIILFPWYLEIIILGTFYDALFGIPGPWYYHGLHTVIFALPLFLGEFIKRRIHV